MDKIIALLIYIFETMKFVVISYYIIGLKSSNGKKKYLMIPYMATTWYRNIHTGKFEPFKQLTTYYHDSNDFIFRG